MIDNCKHLAAGLLAAGGYDIISIQNILGQQTLSRPKDIRTFFLIDTTDRERTRSECSRMQTDTRHCHRIDLTGV